MSTVIALDDSVAAKGSSAPRAASSTLSLEEMVRRAHARLVAAATSLRAGKLAPEQDRAYIRQLEKEKFLARQAFFKAKKRANAANALAASKLRKEQKEDVSSHVEMARRAHARLVAAAKSLRAGKLLPSSGNPEQDDAYIRQLEKQKFLARQAFFKAKKLAAAAKALAAAKQLRKEQKEDVSDAAPVTLSQPGTYLAGSFIEQSASCPRVAFLQLLKCLCVFAPRCVMQCALRPLVKMEPPCFSLPVTTPTWRSTITKSISTATLLAFTTSMPTVMTF